MLEIKFNLHHEKAIVMLSDMVPAKGLSVNSSEFHGQLKRACIGKDFEIYK